MSITVVLGTLYMWWAEVDHFPWGPKEVRKLLLARGFGGFFGREQTPNSHPRDSVKANLYVIQFLESIVGNHADISLIVHCTYADTRVPEDSLRYIPLGEATVITFLAPIVACWACSILMHQPFTRTEQVAGLVSLLGVVLIARPTSFFSASNGESPVATGADDAIPATNATLSKQLQSAFSVTSTQRLFAVGVALIGVLGAACAYTTIRWIGQRAHPLISVNYFAIWSTFVATLVLLFVPGMHFKLPSGLRQWAYLIFLGVCGFIMQLMLTAGLSYEKSSRATTMVYTQMLFALAFDKLVFNTTLGALSIVGSSLILGSALYIAIQQDPSKKSEDKERPGRDEEVGLMAAANDDERDVMVNEDGQPPGGTRGIQLQTIRVP